MAAIEKSPGKSPERKDEEGPPVNHARSIEEGRAELDRRQRAAVYQRKTAAFIENFMLEYPGHEPPDFWDPYNNVKEYILHDQTKKRGIFQSHDLYGKDDLTSEHSEFARRCVKLQCRVLCDLLHVFSVGMMRTGTQRVKKRQ